MGNAGLVAGNPRFLRRLSVLESPSHRTMGIFQSKKKVKVAVVGLDNSGKSTILNKLKPKQATINEVTPTVGFSTEEFEHGSAKFKAWDFSGQSRYRELWQHYYAESKGIIFVVDSTDKIRMCVAKEELNHLLRHADSVGKPILFFSNKTDRPDSLDAGLVWDELGLDAIADRPLQIQPSDALR